MEKTAVFLFIGLTAFSCCFAEEMTPSQQAQRDHNAIQRVYLKGVPHTDINGHPLTQYDKDKSFLPIMLWGVPAPQQIFNVKYDWKPIKDAGFNTVWPWPKPRGEVFAEADKLDLQVILMHGYKIDELKKLKDDKHFLGVVWHDEPTGKVGSSVDMGKMFSDFKKYKDDVHRVCGNNRLVFINDCPWITAPATAWWTRWNTAGDVSCHDNYPIKTRKKLASSIACEPNGIPQTITLATAVNRQKKPVWFIVGPFTQSVTRPDGGYPFRFPTAVQLRTQVYTSLIHGATGICYFIYDSFLAREAGLVGVSPNPQMSYGNPNAKIKANPDELVQAKALWSMIKQINVELAELKPAILSPTSKTKYRVKIKAPKTPSSEPLRCLLKEHPDGGYILLTANNDDAVLYATYTFPEGIEKLEVMFENRTYLKELNEKSFSLVYEPFESHVVRIHPRREK